MKEKSSEMTWGEVGLFALGNLAGALLGVYAMVRIASAIEAQAPGFWFVSRAAGIVAYVLVWASAAFGILLSSRTTGGFFSGALAYALHNITSWLGLAFGVVHALALLGDRIVPFTIGGVLIPFTARYQAFLTGLGTLSLYVGVLVSVTFYWKKWIGHRAWRVIHALSYLMFVAVTAHGAILGTDSGTALMRAVYLVAGGSVLFLTLYRILTAGATQSRAAATVRSTPG